MNARKPESKLQDDLKLLSLPDLAAKLGCTEEGLSQIEAEKRLAEYGPNEIKEAKPNFILRLLGYFWGPIPWMIEIAAVLSGLVNHWPDFHNHCTAYF